MSHRISKPTSKSVEGTSRKPTGEESGESAMHRIGAFIRSERFRFIIALLLGVFCLYLLLAYISFVFTGANDFSIMEMERAARREHRGEIANWMGLPGAAMIYGLVHVLFGLPALILVVIGELYALKMLKVLDFKSWKWGVSSLFLLLYISVVLAYFQDMVGWDTFFRWGGGFGALVNGWVVSYVYPIGAFFIFAVVLIIFLICIDPNTIPNLQRFGAWFVALFKRKPEESPEDGDMAVITDESLEDTGETVIDLTPVNEEKPVIATEKEDATLQIELVETEQPESDSVYAEPTSQVIQKIGEDADLKIEQTKEVEMQEQDPDFLLRTLGPFDPKKDLEFYTFPKLELLKIYPNETAPVVDKAEQQANANKIVATLRNYGIEIESIKATIGPTVTLYEVVPQAGIRIAKIQNLENDIMMSLSAKGIRIIAPMPGKGTVGIEVPNENPQVVSMHSVVASKRFQDDKKLRLPVAMGRTITNEVFMFDLAKTPHLLVAGATGQGKSVAINAIITSLLYKKHPAELKFVMVDPKMVEFAPYKPLIKHYLAAMPDTNPNDVVITDCDKVVNVLNSLVIEMENRYKLLMDAGVRNLEDYNEKFINRRLNPEKIVVESLHHQFLPYIVIIIDEYGDFIMQAGKQVETPIARITQKARAVGMHMILATQRPSVNIVTGVIKANIPTRIALRTQSVIDSRTVLDAKGADQLIGRGDMLYSGNGEITRIQCAFVDTPEVDAVVEHIEQQQHYSEPYLLPEYIPEGGDGEAVVPGSVDMKRLDPMFADVARYVVTKQEGSTSRLQRAFEIGYNRAGKLSDQLEAAGIVGPNKGPKGRDVLIQDLDSLDKILESLGVN